MKVVLLIGAALGLTGSQQAPPEIVYSDSSRLHVIRDDGTGKRRLTTSRYSETQPAYSPDGKRIAFVSRRGGNEDIYVMNADGTNVRRLTTARAPDIQPAWSPNGRQIVFTSQRNANFKLYVMNANGSKQRVLTQTARWVANSSPSWSPDGRWIAFASNRLKDGNGEVFKMRPDGSRVTRLTFTDTNTELSPDDGFPQWSPDGKQIVFSSTRVTGQHDLWVMSPTGKNLRRVTRTPTYDDWGARWSRDGTRIVFYAVPLNGTVSDVYVVNADGTNLRRITRGTSPVWRP